MSRQSASVVQYMLLIWCTPLEPAASAPGSQTAILSPQRGWWRHDAVLFCHPNRYPFALLWTRQVSGILVAMLRWRITLYYIVYWSVLVCIVHLFIQCALTTIPLISFNLDIVCLSLCLVTALIECAQKSHVHMQVSYQSDPSDPACGKSQKRAVCQPFVWLEWVRSSETGYSGSCMSNRPAMNMRRISRSPGISWLLTSLKNFANKASVDQKGRVLDKYG